MSLGNSRAEQALTRLIADTIVEKEVMEPMSKIGWGHGTPPPPDYGTTPQAEGAPAPVAPAAAPAPSGQPAAAPAASPTAPVAKTDDLNALLASIEALRGPDGLIAGKYRDPSAALKGLGHLTQYAKTGFSRAEQAEAEAARLRAENAQLRTSPAASPAAAPAVPAQQTALRQELEAAQASYDAVLSSISESGGLLEGENAKSLASAERKLRELSTRVAVEDALTARDSAGAEERGRWEAVDSHMRENFPESLQFTEEIGLHVKANPLLQRAVSALVAQGDEISASVMAWEEFRKSQQLMTGIKTQAELKEQEGAAREQVRQEFVAQARKDAGVVTGSAGGAGIHEAPGIAGPSQEQIQQAAEAMRREGASPGSRGAAAWREMVIGRYLDPSIFGA